MKNTMKCFTDVTDNTAFLEYILDTFVNGQFNQVIKIFSHLLVNEEYDDFLNEFDNSPEGDTKEKLRQWIFKNLPQIIEDYNRIK